MSVRLNLENSYEYPIHNPDNNNSSNLINQQNEHPEETSQTESTAQVLELGKELSRDPFEVSFLSKEMPPADFTQKQVAEILVSIQNMDEVNEIKRMESENREKLENLLKKV